MKVLLYTEGLKTISKSGLGKAIKHQMKALEDNKIDYTTSLKDDFDVLHINFYGPKSYLFAKKAKKKGKTIVYHAHSTEEDFRNSFLFSNLVAPLFKKWLIKCYSLGDHLITPTEYSKRLLENYNIGRPIHAISNGVETKFFEKNEKAGLDFRKTYGYSKKDKVIVGIGLYIERKGILDFVELAKRLPDYKFIWFGYSPLWASPRKIKKAVTTKLPNLHFAGYVDSSMIKAALSGANLYLFPTLEETEGIPIIEALTSKIPTLIRDIPVFEEYEANKAVYKAKDVDEFEEMIPKIIEGKLPDLTEEGYKVAKKKDLKTVGKEMIKVYEAASKSKKKEYDKDVTDNNKKKDEKQINNSEFIKKQKTLKIYSLILGIFAITIGLLLSTKDLKIKELTLTKYTKTIEYMDTEIKLDIYTTSDKKAEKAFKGVEEIYADYDKLTERDSSDDILRYIDSNTVDSEYLVIDEKLYDMIEYGINWYDKSNGLLNINCGDLTDLWASYAKTGEGIPTLEELNNTNTNIKDIVLKDGNKIKNNNPNINLDFIRKGYVTEEAAKYLESLGIDVYIINADGIIKTGEYYLSEGEYLISVENPYRFDDTTTITSLYLSSTTTVSLSTYNNFFEYEDKIYPGLINTNTKYPAYNMEGVIVLHDNAADAEALAVTLMYMSISDGQKYIEEYKNAEAMWAYVDSDNVKKKAITENFYNYNK